MPVEILMLTDNKQRSIGAKRQALLDIARGTYVGFVDDDDTVSENYVEAIARTANESAPDVIVFDSFCVIGDGPAVLCRHDLHNANEEYNPAGFCRKPWHIHYWRREIAQAARFPDLSYGEDWPWCEQMLRHAKTQARASEKPLYTYHFDPAVSEAHV
jgi:hypothetical protein